MKSIKFIFLISSLFISRLATGQDSFEKGDLSINAGISFGVIGYGYGFGASGFPIPLTANVDYGISDLVSIGPYIGYMRRTYGFGNDITFTSVSFGGQAAFHLSSFLNENLDLDINENKVDYYAKLILGYETYSWNYGNGLNSGVYGDSGRVIFGPVLGVRYLFNPHFGVYAEGGRGAFGYLNLGVSLKL